MHFQMEAQILYHKANQTGKRTIRRCEREGTDPYLKELSAVLSEGMMGKSVELGVLDIPTDKIVGTAGQEEEKIYDSGFMPLPDGDSEFAAQWCGLYLRYLSDEEVRTPITCYEYLGRFYVVDGKKRVSMLKSHGVHTLRACVTRILPVQTEDAEICRYYDFLQDFERTKLYQLSFTQPGSLPKLQAALGYDANHIWNDVDRFGFLFHWYLFEYAFQEAFRGEMPITTADAFLVMLEEFPYHRLKKMEPWILTSLIRDRWEKFYKICYPDFAAALERRVKKVS